MINEYCSVSTTLNTYTSESEPPVSKSVKTELFSCSTKTILITPNGSLFLAANFDRERKKVFRGNSYETYS